MCEQSPRLALILGAARSGTTLLRSLLDAHPEVGCPAETGLAGLINHTRHVWQTISASLDPTTVRVVPSDGEPQPVGFSLTAQLIHQDRPLPIAAERAIRDSALALMTHYCAAGEAVYCDKSLGNVGHVGAVARSFPDARFVVLVRHVMDTIASGLEATPWGFDAFGYAGFVRDSPENTVAALARYWEHQVSLALSVRDEYPDATLVVRYEDLVDHPDHSLRVIFEFLRVSSDHEVFSRAFDRFTMSSGPGDYKLAYSSSVHNASVGRGKRVPIQRFSEPLTRRLSDLLVSCGYQGLSPRWNFEPLEADRTTSAEREALGNLKLSHTDEAWTAPVNVVGIVADNSPTLRWIVDLASRTLSAGDGDVDLVIAGSAADLLRAIQGNLDLPEMIRSGRIRTLLADQEAGSHTDLPRLLRELFACLEVSRADQIVVNDDGGQPTAGDSSTNVGGRAAAAAQPVYVTVEGDHT